jgi:Protein of unknown function (DUF3341)
MSVKKFVVGIFTDEQVLFPAVKKVRSAGYKIHDVYTPMPIHGLDDALGLRQTSLHTAGFIYGITGTTTALSGIGWVFNSDWPQNYDGKSHFDLPAWIPITFELTVLFSAVGMFLTFCFLCQIAPFVRKHHFNLRSTDDQFTMVIECTDKSNEADIAAFLASVGAVGINTQIAEMGWWLGRYDSNVPPLGQKELI